MLGKLIKNEFKQTSKSLVAVYSAAGVSILFMLLSYLTKIAWLGAAGSVALIFIGVAAIIMTLVMVINNFARSLYGSQGYLSYTLPVRCSSLLFSKFFVSFVWIIVSYLVMMLTAFIVAWYTKSQSNGMFESAFEMIKELQIISDLPTLKLILEYLLILGLGSIVSVISFVSFVYFAITVANTRKFQNKPVLFGMIFFFIVYFLNKTISTELMLDLPLSIYVSGDKIGIGFESMQDAGNVLFNYGIGGKLFTLVFAVLLLVVTGVIMEKKVNVK
ncbi:MAG: hypothetical protein ACI4GA_00340 [Acutalibacteraceae bacterium]|nr:hypothetical protein [Oscillospiraceae bacterium]